MLGIELTRVDVALLPAPPGGVDSSVPRGHEPRPDSNQSSPAILIVISFSLKGGHNLSNHKTGGVAYPNGRTAACAVGVAVGAFLVLP